MAVFPSGSVPRQRTLRQFRLLYAFELRVGWLGRPVGSGALCTSCRRLPAGDRSVPLRDQPGALIWRHLIFLDRTRDGGLCVWRLDEADQFQRTLDVIDAPRRVLRLDQS